VPPNKAFSERHPEKVKKMSLFLEKSRFFAHSLRRQRDVLSWQMIARRHSKVQPTSGTLRVFKPFSGFEFSPAPEPSLSPPTCG
jgi:hypothetical protein